MTCAMYATPDNLSFLYLNINSTIQIVCPRKHPQMGGYMTKSICDYFHTIPIITKLDSMKVVPKRKHFDMCLSHRRNNYNLI